MHRALSSTLLLFCFSGASLAAEKDAERAAAKLITPVAERSIERGLQWLSLQQHDNGGFGSGPFRGNVAVGSLAGMAMMSGGSTPGRGPYGGQLNRCHRLSSGQHPTQRIHRGPRRQPRPDVRPRLRHHVPGRVLRHVAPARAARKTGQSRENHRQLSEQTGRLALPAGSGRCRHLGHRVRNHGPARPATPASSSPTRRSTARSTT